MHWSIRWRAMQKARPATTERVAFTYSNTPSPRDEFPGYLFSPHGSRSCTYLRHTFQTFSDDGIDQELAWDRRLHLTVGLHSLYGPIYITSTGSRYCRMAHVDNNNQTYDKNFHRPRDYTELMTAFPPTTTRRKTLHWHGVLGTLNWTSFEMYRRQIVRNVN